MKKSLSHHPAIPAKRARVLMKAKGVTNGTVAAAAGAGFLIPLMCKVSANDVLV
jgi:hypothetical protein